MLTAINGIGSTASDAKTESPYRKDTSSGGSTSNNSGHSSSGGNSGTSVSSYKDTYIIVEGATSTGISRNSLQGLVSTGKPLTVSDSRMALTFDSAALKAVLSATAGASDGMVTFHATSADISQSADAKALIGSRPVLDLTITYQKNGQAVTAPVDLGPGKVIVAIKYDPAPTEATGGLYAAYVDKDGKTVLLDDSSYDRDRNAVIFNAAHFSVYGVAYKAPAPAFTDTVDHWAKDDIDFAAVRGLLSGTGNDQFSPNTSMTRGMFVTALGRLAGVDPASYTTRSFTDVKADAYYAPYIEWAAQKNIVKGTSATAFAPDQAVTRQEMAVMMTNYAGQMGYPIPATLAEAAFTDSSQISEWAAKEVKAMQRAGIIKGKDGNRFDPQGNATRAEVSAVLRRFVELVIDPATAQGWKKNDSGHWLYYKDGKALTGWQTVDGRRYHFNDDGVMYEGWKQDTATGLWYYFNPDGSMAVSKKIDGYEVGPDGARL